MGAIVSKKSTRSPIQAQGEVDPSLPPDTLQIIVDGYHQHGDIYSLNTRGESNLTYVVSHPDWAQQILATHHHKYIRGPANDRMALLLGKSLLISEQGAWKTQRKIIQPCFRNELLLQFSDIMANCNQTLLSQWQQAANEGRSINLTQDILHATLMFSLTAIFSEDTQQVLEHGGEAFFSRLTEESTEDTRSNLLFIKQFKDQKILIEAIIDNRRQSQRRPFDFMSLLMDSRYKDTGEFMATSQLIDEIMSLVTAGHATVASSVTSIWQLLATQPSAEQKLHDELDHVLAGRMPTVVDLANLPYSKHVAQEAMRLQPPVWVFTRKALTEDWLGDYYVPSGTDIFISPYLTHRHPGFWHNPETFEPDRFKDEAFTQQHKQAYIPFAAGPRNCIGQHLSMFEMQLHIAAIAQHVKLTPVAGNNYDLDPGFVLRTQNDIFMNVEAH